MRRNGRALEPEIMDQPGLDEARHHAALRGLARINLWSRTVSPLFDAVASLTREQGLARVRLLDIASGGGDVPIRLWRRARRSGLPLEVHGCDVNPRAVEYARRRARQSGAEAKFFTLDAVNDPFPEGYDVLTCTLFLHHLEEDRAVHFLRRMAAAAPMLAVDDLRRSSLGAALAFAGTRILSRSDVVHVDGLRSVRAAFTMDEVAGLAQRAGLRRFAIRPHWPFRFLLTWRRG